MYLSNIILGVAYTGTLCASDGYSSSVTEDRGGYQCSDTAANELGHSFSAQHDGDTNIYKYSDRYIMASSNSDFTNATRLNPWRISNCSIQYIKSYTDQLMQSSSGATCLTDRKTVTSGLPDVSESLPGLNVSINDQCRMIYGYQSVACQAMQNLDLDPTSICSLMNCGKTGGSCFEINGALPGTTCGSRKACLFGDDHSYVINNMTCSRMALTQTWLCYDSDVRPNCRVSSKSIYRPYQDYEYGDHVTGCTTDVCSNNLINCCATCNHSVPITSTSATASTSTAATAPSSSPSSKSATTSSSSAASDQLNLPPPSTTVLSWLLLLFILALVTSI
ncbi:A disintegrin and metalloproteinase with thrombospondin motifs 7 [Bulinus truncatus]|nr:A disintegrin and metalloproteinase with thrombospondin motifs 7 [Bulinus truncatus]